MTITENSLPRLVAGKTHRPVAPIRQLDTTERHRPIPPTLRAMRPRQWVKNALVLAAPFAAGSLFTGGVLVSALLAIVVMCAAASTTYLLNDVSDRDRDRRHPTKCRRPIAAGELSVPAALVLASATAAAALALAAVLSAWTCVFVAAYLVMTISYSRRLKHVANLELGVVAAGFVLRVLVGAAATATPLSAPFLIVVGAGALFLAIAKRYAELSELGADAALHRPVLAHYTLDGLHVGLATSMGVALLSYVVWAVGVEELTLASPWVGLSVVPVAIAAARAYRRAIAGGVGDPTELVLGDRVLQFAGLATAALLLVGLYT